MSQPDYYTISASAVTNMEEWIRALDERGSTNDPIWYQGEETSPESLSYRFHPLDDITKLRITYWGGKPHRKIKGTARGMVRDRNGFMKYRRLNAEVYRSRFN